MQTFVFWTGIYNIILGIGLLMPPFVTLLGIQAPESNFWLWISIAFLIYLGLLLILCSRNLKARASLVYWEGVLRVVAFFLLAGFGFFGDIGFIVGIIGLIDLLIGIGYFIGLPKALNTTPAHLLLDKAI